MRPFYPVNSKESIYELNTIQEHLANLIGHDINPHDNNIDVPGKYDDYEEEIQSSGTAMLEERMFANPTIYSYIYKQNLIYNIRRGVCNG